MTALYAGSFDPFTLGHLDIALRSAKIFGRVIIGVARNIGKNSPICSAKRKEIIDASLGGWAKDIEVCEYDEPTTDFAARMNCDVIVRGVRGLNDFESERTLARIYGQLSGIETVFLPACPMYEHISSSLVRELIFYGKSIDNFVDDGAKEMVLSVYKKI